MWSQDFALYDPAGAGVDCRGLPHVLIIDDDTDSREAVGEYVRRAGHPVRTASNGREALAALVEEVPHAVILDVRMPDVDGIAVLEVIRSYLKWWTVPVAIFTAYPEDQRLSHLQKAGANRVFAKGKHHVGDVLKWINELRADGAAGG